MSEPRKRRVSRDDVISRLMDLGIEFFTLDDLASNLELNHVQAKKTAERLVQANQARRIQRGLYSLVHPADWLRQGSGYTANWYLTAARLIEPRPYYLAFYTAMEIHNMLEHPLLTVFVATTVQKKQVVVPPLRVRFVKVVDRRFFGSEEKEVRPGSIVDVATLERTFMDAVDRPSLCGGLEQVVSGFKRRVSDLNSDRLGNLLYRLDEPTVTKRLGFLLEHTGFRDPGALADMERMAGRLGHFSPLVPGAVMSKRSWRDTRWELEIDVPLHDLQRMGTT